MPVKTKKPHHAAHKRERRSKTFLKVYHPFIPVLLFLIGAAFFASYKSHQSQQSSVLDYAVNTSREGLLESSNSARLKHGIEPLALDQTLNNAAQEKAKDMAARNYWSHDTPDGQEPWYFLEQQGYDYSKAAENLAFGFKNDDATIGGWMNSPGHRANLLDQEVSKVGFGIINIPNYQNKGPQTLVVAFYAQPNTENTLPVAPSNTKTEVLPSNSPKEISYIQSLTNGVAPWSGFVSGLILGITGSYLVTKHALGVRRALRVSERYMIKHPLLDASLIAVVTIAVIASQTVGFVH